MLIAQYRQTHNRIRPLSTLGCRPPAAGGHTACGGYPDACATNVACGTRLGGRSVVRPRLPPRIPIALRCVIEKSLHKDHRKRLRSATRMLHALKQSPAT